MIEGLYWFKALGRFTALRSRLPLGCVLAVALSCAAYAANEESTDSSEDMSVGEAADNIVDDSKKVGDAVVEGAEDAYDSTKEAIEEATE